MTGSPRRAPHASAVSFAGLSLSQIFMIEEVPIEIPRVIEVFPAANKRCSIAPGLPGKVRKLSADPPRAAAA
jgi:hypothetical protein